MSEGEIVRILESIPDALDAENLVSHIASLEIAWDSELGKETP